MDYKQLLQPIEGESATGCYLKDDRTAYRALRNNFNAAQSSFRRLIETPDSTTDETLFEENEKNWQTVSDACWQTLTEKSKDVEIYCWWVMSLAFQRDSITKIASALETLNEFIENFWPDVQPYLPDNKLKSEDATEQAAQRAELQLRPLIQLLGESANSGLLYMPLQMLSLVGEIDHAQYFSASKSGKLAELKAQAKKDFSSYKDDITSTVIALDNALNSVIKLDVWLKAITTKLAISAVSAQFIKENLNDCLQAIKYLVFDSYPVWPLDKPVESAAESVTNTVDEAIDAPQQETVSAPVINTTEQSSSVQNTVQITQQVLNVSAQLANRDQAFQELRKIADYFSKTEPHSPVSFLLEKAIRWGYMSLPDLMQELVSGNDKILGQINLVTGIDSEKADISAYKPAPVEIKEVVQPPQKQESTPVVEAPIVQDSSENEIPSNQETSNTSTDSDFSW